MTKISSVLLSLFLYEMIVCVYVASLPTNCEEPEDLNAQHERAVALSIQNETLLLVKMSSNNATSRKNEYIMKSSTCPWHDEVINDSTLFPSVYRNAVCDCNKCKGDEKNMYECELITTPSIFLKRSRCESGRYVYEPILLNVFSGCACVSKKVVTD